MCATCDRYRSLLEKVRAAEEKGAPLTTPVLQEIIDQLESDLDHFVEKKVND